MTSVKLKFRPSTSPNREGSLIFQLIHDRTLRRIKSTYKIFSNEWDEAAGQILLPPPSSLRFRYLQLLSIDVNWELHRLQRMAEVWTSEDPSCHIDDVVRSFTSTLNDHHSVFKFINAQIQRKKQLGKIRSSETYQATLNSFMRFRKGIDLSFDMIDPEMMELYEADLRRQGLTRNTSSFYMRILRTNYKLAVEQGLTRDRMPFRHVYCGIDKTVKRSISLADIKRIKDLDLSLHPVLDYTRDMFLFSFYTRGMSFIDMAYLKRSDLKNGYLSYRRKKTGQLLTIEWTPQMQDILDNTGLVPPATSCPSSPVRTATSDGSTRTR